MNRLNSKLEKIGRDPRHSARAVGLRYSANFGRGYYRIREKNAFTYVDEDQNTIKNKEILKRIKLLVLPPAWENVWISSYINGHLQATGIDAKGRKQYRYHPDWNKIRNQSKFYRLKQFANAIGSIREQVDKDLARKGLPYEKVVALVVKLIELTHIRIGNDAYKKLYGSFGLTTLRDRHVKIDSTKVQFEFIGKKGIKHKIALQSRRMANLVKKCRDIPGQDLFQYYDDEGKRHTIGSSDVNNYLKQITGEDFTAKDFRVWAGSVHALCAFHEIGEPENQTDGKRKVVEVLDTVATKLGNTRTVCKKYYVHPSVISAFENGRISTYAGDPDLSGKLYPEEEALVRLLETENLVDAVA